MYLMILLWFQRFSLNIPSGHSVIKLISIFDTHGRVINGISKWYQSLTHSAGHQLDIKIISIFDIFTMSHQLIWSRHQLDIKLLTSKWYQNLMSGRYPYYMYNNFMSLPVAWSTFYFPFQIIMKKIWWKQVRFWHQLNVQFWHQFDIKVWCKKKLKIKTRDAGTTGAMGATAPHALSVQGLGGVNLDCSGLSMLDFGNYTMKPREDVPFFRFSPPLS